MVRQQSFSAEQKRVITGSKFIRDWLTCFKQRGENVNDDEDETSATIVSNDTTMSPIQIPSFNSLLNQLFKKYMNPQSSTELLITLLEILSTVTKESDWKLIFESHA